MLDFAAPKLRAYPVYTVVAEKFHAMVWLGIANSRMKDFYDLWISMQKFPFEGHVLSTAIGATFTRRNTPLPTEAPLALTQAFANDHGSQNGNRIPCYATSRWVMENPAQRIMG